MGDLTTERCVHCGEPISLNGDGNLAHEFSFGGRRWWRIYCPWMQPYGRYQATRVLGGEL